MQKVMTTSQQQTSVNGADEWTCSLEAFRASLSVTPGGEEARKMTATSGRQCIAPSMKSSPLGLWLKTLLESSRWSSRARFLRWQAQPLFSTRLTTFEDDTNSERPLPCNASAQTLKVTDMPSSRCLFRLVPSEPPTDETGCSSSQGVLLQTPTTVQTDEPPEKMRARAEKNGYKNGTKFGSLTSQIKYDPKVQPFLKTPCTADSYTDKMKSKGVSGTSGTLAQEVVNGYAEKHRGLLLPTPIATDISHKQRVDDLKQAGGQTMASRANGANRPNGLSDFIRFYEIMPTPTARDWKGPQACEYKDMRGEGNEMGFESVPGIVAKAFPSDDGTPSRLSPLFTEEMMGFPLMWTALPFLSESGAPKPSKPTATR